MSEPKDEDVKNIVEMWKKTIDVQQHFNDLGLRLRNYAITLLTAILGVTGLAIKDKVVVSIFNNSIPLASVLLIAGIIIWNAFHFMDRWYHHLLLGAVHHGESIEELLLEKYPYIGLTTRISAESKYKLFGWRVRSITRISLFYIVVSILLLITAYVVSFGP